MDHDGLPQDGKVDSPVYSLREQRTEGDMTNETAPGTSTQYRTYKRRWYGLITLVLMNIVVSWCVSTDYISSPSHKTPFPFYTRC